MNDLDQFNSLILSNITKIQRLYSIKLNQKLSEINLTLSEFRIVGLLLGEEAGYSQKELANLLGITAASLSTSIQKLSAKEVIHQINDPDDKRIKRILIKPQLDFSKIHNILNQLEAEAILDISDEDLTTAKHVLQQILKNISI